VALSRAKIGFYVVGDFDMFASVSSFWKYVLGEVKQQKAFGAALPIKCQQLNKEINLKTITDFNSVEQFDFVVL
jgi:hypothetical protein